MTKTKSPADIINELLDKAPTSRDFARSINEDAADIIRWRYGRSKIKPRAVIAICRLHPELRPHDLNPDIFPADLSFFFGDNTNE